MEYTWHLPQGSMGAVFIDSLEWQGSKKWRTLATSAVEALQPAVYGPWWDGASSATMTVVNNTLTGARKVSAEKAMHICAEP